MDEPKFEHMTDREILILVCKQTWQNTDTLKTHGTRLRALEGWRTFLAGAGATLEFLVHYGHK